MAVSADWDQWTILQREFNAEVSGSPDERGLKRLNIMSRSWGAGNMGYMNYHGIVEWERHFYF